MAFRYRDTDTGQFVSYERYTEGVATGEGNYSISSFTTKAEAGKEAERRAELEELDEYDYEEIEYEEVDLGEDDY